MDWRVQPLLPWLVIGTLALLAIPRAAHPQSAALVTACWRSVARQCPAEVKAFSKNLDRKPVGECVKTKFDDLAPRCRAVICKEFPAELGGRCQ